METIRNYIEALFATLPQNADTQRIKADMLSNLEESITALRRKEDKTKRGDRYCHCIHWFSR